MLTVIIFAVNLLVEEMKGLTSKERLFLRVLSVVAIIDAVTFYAASRNLQTFIANFTEVITLITVLTLFVLTIQLEFWWRYCEERTISDFGELLGKQRTRTRLN